MSSHSTFGRPRPASVSRGLEPQASSGTSQSWLYLAIACGVFAVLIGGVSLAMKSPQKTDAACLPLGRDHASVSSNAVFNEGQAPNATLSPRALAQIDDLKFRQRRWWNGEVRLDKMCFEPNCPSNEIERFKTFTGLYLSERLRLLDNLYDAAGPYAPRHISGDLNTAEDQDVVRALRRLEKAEKLSVDAFRKPRQGLLLRLLLTHGPAAVPFCNAAGLDASAVKVERY